MDKIGKMEMRKTRQIVHAYNHVKLGFQIGERRNGDRRVESVKVQPNCPVIGSFHPNHFPKTVNRPNQTPFVVGVPEATGNSTTRYASASGVVRRKSGMASSDPPPRPHLSPEQLAWCAEGLRAFKSLLQSPSSISAEYDRLRVPHLPRNNWVPLSSQKYLSSDATAGEKPTTEKPATVGDKFTTEKPAEASHKNGGSGGSEETGPAGKPIRGGPVSWLSLVLLMLTGGGLLVYYDKEKKRHLEELKTASTTPRQGPSVGTPAIGGPFKLVNHDGKSVTEQDFLGKWTILYFGFTHCPDICPEELQKLCAAIDKIKEKVNLEIVPVFISVDPERDTVEQVGEYVEEFHPNLIGLTGTPDEVKKVARAYRVYYMKTEEEGSDYLVDHSIVMYLMSPEMQFVKFFGKNYDVDSLTEGIIKEVKQHGK